MEFLTQLLTGGANSQWILIFLISASVFAFVIALTALFDDFFDPVRYRFKRKIDTAETLAILESDALSKKLRQHNNIFIPSDTSLLQRTTLRLHYAGFHSRNSLIYYYAIRMVLIIGLPLLVLITTPFIHIIKSGQLLQTLLLATAIGYLLPSFTLDRLIANRQKILRRSFPDALDLLIVCSEAGLSLDSALQKVASEINLSQPVLAEELNIVITEIRVGIDRNKALQRLVERTGVDEIRGLVSALSQSMRFGTSIIDTMKVYAEDLRDRRMQAAEAIAAKIGTKLLFPLAFCLLPAFLIVALAPSVIILKNLGH